MRVRQDGPSGLPFEASAPPPIALPPPPEQSTSLPRNKGKQPLFLPRASNSPPSDSQAQTCFKIRIPGMNDRKARLGDLGFSSDELEKDELVEEKDELNEQDVPMADATLSLPSEVSYGCH